MRCFCPHANRETSCLRAVVAARQTCAPHRASAREMSTLSALRLGGIRARLQLTWHRMQPMLMGPAVVRPPQLPDALEPALVGAQLGPTHAAPRSALRSLFDGILLMAVPKKRTSYSRKRIRRAGQIASRGPQLQAHFYMCPVCERMRAPHRVCERQDCVTYFKHRWF